MTSILNKRKEEVDLGHTEGKVTRRQRETGVMQPQTKQWLEPQEAGRGQGRILTQSPSRENETVNTLILDLWPLELRENKILLFQDTKIMVIFYSSPGKLIHWDIF